MEINIENWHEFEVGKLFEVTTKTAKNSNYKKSKEPEDDYVIPALSSKATDNSFGFYVREKDHNLIDELCLSVTSNGDAGKVFVQNKPFAIIQDAYALKVKDYEVSLFGYFFLATILEERLINKYGFNEKATWSKVKKEIIPLPAIYNPEKEDYDPDWNYMEEFIKELKNKNKEKLDLLNIIYKLEKEEICGENFWFDTGNWYEFKFRDIFDDIKKGTRIKKEDRIPGKIPLITAGEINNGLACYIENNDTLFTGKCITVDMFGNAFYRDYPFYADDNVIVFKNDEINMFEMLFLTSVISKIASKYSYKEQFRLNSIDKIKIPLPPLYNFKKRKYEPDWEYMTYITRMMYDLAEFRLRSVKNE